MASDKAAEVTRRLKRVAEDQFPRLMEEAGRIDPDRSHSTTTADRRMALSAALDAAMAALRPDDAPAKSDDAPLSPAAKSP